MPTPQIDKNCRLCLGLRMIAVALWTIALIVLSLYPDGGTPHVFSGQDKLLHFLAYFLAAWLVARTLHVYSFSVARSAWVAVLYSLLLGGCLEVLQGVTGRNRSAEWLDLVADIAGAACGGVIFCLIQKRSYRNEESPSSAP